MDTWVYMPHSTGTRIAPMVNSRPVFSSVLRSEKVGKLLVFQPPPTHRPRYLAFGLLDNLSSRDCLHLHGSLMIQNIELLWTHYVKVEMLPI